MMAPGTIMFSGKVASVLDGLGFGCGGCYDSATTNLEPTWPATASDADGSRR